MIRPCMPVCAKHPAPRNARRPAATSPLPAGHPPAAGPVSGLWSAPDPRGPSRAAAGQAPTKMRPIDISFLRSPRVLRFLRYAVGSATASAVSAVTLAAAYQGIGLDPRVSSISAFCAGALVNFLIYRFWAWRATADAGAAAVRRDFLKYAVVA